MRNALLQYLTTTFLSMIKNALKYSIQWAIDSVIKDTLFCLAQ